MILTQEEQKELERMIPAGLPASEKAALLTNLTMLTRDPFETTAAKSEKFLEGDDLARVRYFIYFRKKVYSICFSNY